jgi:hypothetical protein
VLLLGIDGGREACVRPNRYSTAEVRYHITAFLRRGMELGTGLSLEGEGLGTGSVRTAGPTRWRGEGTGNGTGPHSGPYTLEGEGLGRTKSARWKNHPRSPGPSDRERSAGGRRGRLPERFGSHPSGKASLPGSTPRPWVVNEFSTGRAQNARERKSVTRIAMRINSGKFANSAVSDRE